jgi:dissimilatory sulfite reductase related protein
MAEKTIAGINVKVNDEGYFEDASQWTKEMAIAMSSEINLTLTDKHFAVLDFIRQKHIGGEVLTIRKVGTSGIIDIKEFYQLFPGGPLKLASKLAGIPKPTSCV